MMIRAIQRIGLISFMCLMLFGCSLLVKELHLSLPAEIVAEDPYVVGTLTEWAATVSTAYPVPNPYDGTSADLSVQLIASGPGADNLNVNPGTVVILKGESVGEFFVSASYDELNPPVDPPENWEYVTITAHAVGYDEDSVTITIRYQ